MAAGQRLRCAADRSAASFSGAGQIVRAIGLLQRPLPAMNPGQFDWAAHDAQERVLASFTIKKSADLQILSASSTGPCDALRRIAGQALDRGFPSAIVLIWPPCASWSWDKASRNCATPAR